MSTLDANSQHGNLEECIDLLSDFVTRLDHYPQTVLPLAMGTHLSCLLQELLEQGACNREQVSRFILDLQGEVLSSDGSVERR